MRLEAWYDKGMTFEQYVESMDVNREELKHVYEQLVFTEDDVAIFKEMVTRNWRGIVLTADWCGDAALCVPIIQRIAEESNLPLHFLIRDDNLELMDQYLTNGTSRAIPIFIFIDQDGREQKVWGPRSPEVQEWITSLRADLPANDSPDFKEKQQAIHRQFKDKITTDPEIWRTVINSVNAKLQK